MIHEHDALPLASAALDFELTADAAAELKAALAECPVCAERAAAYREQRRLIARLPIVDVSERTRQRVTAAAVRGRTDSRPMVLLLAAALLLGLTLAIAAAAGAFRTNQPPIDLRGEVSPSLGPSVPAASLVVAASPTAPSGPGGSASAGVLPADSLVQVVSPNLRVRSQPRVADDSAKFEPLLQPGDRLFVIEGPVVANDYDWYRIAPVGAVRNRHWSDLPSGWVARGDHDGTPWIAPVTRDCPAQPVEVAALSAMHRFERIACFGDTPLSLLAVVIAGDLGGWRAVPTMAVDTDTLLKAPELAFAPASGVTPADLPSRRVVRLEGAFDRPAAIGCDADRSDEPALALLDCRSLFVLSDVFADVNHFERQTAAVVATDNLRVRSLPRVAAESARQELLDSGTNVFVIDGPVLASGYAWYQVIVPSVRDQAGRARVGWVAVGGKDGEPWLEPGAFECSPPGELTFDAFAALATAPVYHGGLVCYGSGAAFSQDEVSVEAHLRLECATSPSTGDSNWLAEPRWTLVLVDGGREARAVLPFEQQALPCGGTTSSLTYRVSGQFDHPASFSCRAPDGASDQVANYECRRRFVVSGFYVTGPGPTPQPSAPLN
ncbi:MAG TPA: hypothetical protein VFO73_10730 [Candidatus Limnocylindrales bacterium]|nr:hypothetical protein [Candidatus Limnocylindrales bacterium]